MGGKFRKPDGISHWAELDGKFSEADAIVALARAHEPVKEFRIGDPYDTDQWKPEPPSGMTQEEYDALRARLKDDASRWMRWCNDPEIRKKGEY